MAAGRSRRHDSPLGREDHRGPTSWTGGAPPARSALTARLVLAVFGVLVSTAGAFIVSAAGGSRVIVGVFAALAVIGLADILVIIGRKRRGEPG